MEKNEIRENKDKVLAIIGIIFFVVLALIARSGNKDNLNNKDSDSNSTTDIKDNSTNNEEKSIFTSIEGGNFNFIYTITNNDTKEIIEGKTINDKWKFSVISNKREEYAKISDNYLKLSNGDYLILDTIPYYFKYIDLENILEILNYSISEDDDEKITYEIDIIDLIDKYNPELEYNSFEDFKYDKVILYVNDKNIEKIELDYSNYFTYLNNTDTKFKVVMEFNGFGSVIDFEI